VFDGEVLLPVVAKGLVECAILLGGDVVGIASPNGLGLVENVILLNGLLDLLLGLVLLVVLVIDLLDLGLVAILRGLLLILNLLETTSENEPSATKRNESEPFQPPWSQRVEWGTI
jgi:hypothetical protein